MASVRIALLTLAAGCSTSFPAPGNFVVDEASGSSTGASTTGAAAVPCDESTEALADCIEQERYVTDLEFIAAERAPGDAHWQAVQDLCFDRFTEYGYDVELHQYGTGVNVVGTRPGTTLPDESVVIAAHYDHIEGCGGADDNATGVSGVLEAARVLAEAEFERTLVVACWDQEENGKIGSRSWVLRASMQGEDIIANFNFEMLGYADSTPNSQRVPLGFDALFADAVEELAANEFRGDFITVVADDLAAIPAEAMGRHALRFELPLVHLELTADLKNSLLVSDLQRSDHANFWEFDYPAMMITDTSNFRYEQYHCANGEDSVDNLDHDFATKVIAVSAGAAADMLGHVPPPV